MGAFAAQHAQQLLGQFTEVAYAGGDTGSFIDRVADELRFLIDSHMSASERSEYVRRLSAGEPVLAVLKDIASQV